MIFKDNSWFVKHPDCKIPDVGRFCEKIIFTPIHPETNNLIKQYSKIFDNIEARIMANPYVEFELINVENTEFAKVKNI